MLEILSHQSEERTKSIKKSKDSEKDVFIKVPNRVRNCDDHSQFSWKIFFYILAAILGTIFLSLLIPLILWQLEIYPFSNSINTTVNQLPINNEDVASAHISLLDKTKNLLKGINKTSILSDDKNDFEFPLINKNVLSQYPYYAGIILTNGVEKDLGCHGTLVNFAPFIKTGVIITAAHCQINDYNATISEVYFHDPKVNKIVIIPVAELDIIPYPNFQFGNHTHGYDVLLIILKNRTVEHTACLPEIGKKTPNKLSKIQFLNSRKMYRKAIEIKTVNLVENGECLKVYSKWYSDIKFDDRFCADNEVKYTENGLSGTSLTFWNGKCNVIYGIYSSGPKEGMTTFDIFMKIKPLSEMMKMFKLE